MRIEGLEAFRKTLRALDKKTANKIVRTELRAGMNAVAAEVRRRAPVESGRMKMSVVVRAGKRKRNIISVQVVISGHEDAVPSFLEYGTRHMAAAPFARPAAGYAFPIVKALVLGNIKRAIEEAGR